MHRLFGLPGRFVLAAAAVASSLTIAGSTTSSSSLFTAPAVATINAPAPVRLTQADVAASNRKAAAAYSALVTMWTKKFQTLGANFAAPQIARYRGAVRTRCGVMAPSNASYCFNSNTIYFDDVFLAYQAKLASQALGTDGDMVAVGIIAHEMGHAVAMQLGHRSRDSYENESTADCLAGAFARQAEADKSIEPGDIEEAFYGMAAAGDPTPESTGDARTDARLARRLARGAHGTREQRQQNFRTGLEGGGAACLNELRGA
jgi:predicted metalloprotease